MEIADLLNCTLQILGRAVIPPDRVRSIIGKSRKKRIHAFNLCDGTLKVTEIAKKARINQGNLSRSLARWNEHGIVYRIGEGKNSKFLHIYPLAKKDIPTT
jgi:hypothetical protein